MEHNVGKSWKYSSGPLMLTVPGTESSIEGSTTILHFRHWLESHELTKGLFDEVGAMLEERGLLIRQSLVRSVVPHWL